MAHYAFLDENNIVASVIVGPDEGTEPEGIDSWEDYFTAKGEGVALRTSYNTSAGKHSGGGVAFRGNYAGIGFKYDSSLDAFVAPQPFPSWTLSDSYVWEPPVAHPEDGEEYSWNEETQAWEPVVEAD